MNLIALTQEKRDAPAWVLSSAGEFKGSLRFCFALKRTGEDFKERGIGIPSIIIDGYNLIGIHHRDLEGERDRLINLLMGYRKRKGHRIVVVFDGWKGGSRTEETVVKGGVRIIYSRLGEKADAVIKRIIATDRQEWIVVSSDREVAAFAWSTGSVPVSSGEFSSLLETKGLETNVSVLVSGKEMDEDNEEAQGCRKGNPRKVSKKERAIRRALCKLL